MSHLSSGYTGETGGIRCSTVGCHHEASYMLTWTWPGEDEPVCEPVCGECGVAYLRRPALRASQSELEPQS